MTPAQKKVHDYLAAIGRRGGLASRRELTRSHAKQMVAIRRSQTRRDQSGQALATAQSQTIEAQVTESDPS